MIVVSAKDLTKAYGTDVILDKVSFHINKGERVGIIGVNGAGKTTLLKMLTGEIPCESGDFFISSDLKTGYFTEINIDYGQDYYYKVCAVKKFVDDSGANREIQSNFTDAMSGRAVDENEFVKRLGRTTGNSPNSTRQTATDSSKRARETSCTSKRMRRSRTKASM